MGDSGHIGPILDWVTSARAAPLAADLVPGATTAQRTHLAVAGGLVGALVPEQERDHWPDALQAWVSAAPTPPARVVERLSRAFEADSDLFASLYCALVGGQQRRRLGTFFTPRPLVEFMLDMITTPKRNATLVDPGAGVGAFALAAAERWPGLNVVAVDVNVATLGLLGAAVHRGNHCNVRLEHADYLTWLTDRQSSAGASPRLLVGNPPYTRHQELDRKSKQSMLDASRNLVTSKLAGLSAYFLASSFNSMRTDDELCFVLPNTWTEARYGRELRAWLWNRVERPVEMHLFPADSEIFPGTRVSAMVLRVGPVQTASDALTRHGATLTEREVTTSPGEAVTRTGDPPRTLGPMLWSQHHHPSGDHVPLSELATVRRGVATGANGFFFITDAAREELPERAVVAALRRLRHVEGDVLDTAEHRRIGKRGQPRWLLTLDNPEVVATPQIQRLIAEGVQAGVPDRYLSTVRDPWYVLERVEPPHLLIAAMAKGRLRVVRNVARVVPSNSIYGIYLKRPSLAKALSLWLTSDEGQAAILAQARHYSDGLRKIEPRDLMRASIPTERRLRDSQETSIASGEA